MSSQEIRDQFLKFFASKGHSIVPSCPVIPHDDPTLLFINAGMNQFKDVFLGKSQREYDKACSTQKCVRVGGKHNDLENVGHTLRHLTFFEMLGNFSFGDYFKKQAIAYAWEVSREIFGFDPKDLWATVFHEDEESFELWKAHVPEERICRMGAEDNFWSMGDTGPCGPCSELYFDRGEKYGSARNPAEDIEGNRFVEYWNLVFMEFNRDVSGNMTPLPKQSVDTGAGLERIISLQMGCESVFETDVLRSLIARVEQIAECPYESNKPAFRVIADHLRSLCFAIADGVTPSNIDRGYVLRKVLRRAVRYARQLGFKKPFLACCVPTLVDLMGQSFPELVAAQSRIEEILILEEENFMRTLSRGGQLLGQVMENAQKSKLISGQDAFKLKDTYGLPLEEILLLAKDADLGVDISAFEELEHEAKERSRGARKVETEEVSASYEEFAKTHGASAFHGFAELTCQAVVLGLMKEGKPVDALHKGEEGTILLDQTPFYAEKGGQVGDHGTLSTETLFVAVIDTQSPYTDVIAHTGVIKEGEIKVGDQICATVDSQRREKIMANHTATHLLHLALQEVFGEHIKQAGSVVEPSKLRFDFSHHKAPTQEQLIEVEKRVNEMVRNNRLVTTYELSYQEAQKKPEIKQFFGDKYGSHVRVVDMGPSKELCGGTHVEATGAIGYFRILSEGSIAGGVRRIEAITGTEAENMAREADQALLKMSHLLKTQPGQLLVRVEKLTKENKELSSSMATLRKQLLAVEVETLLSKIEGEKIPFLCHKLSISPGELKDLADLLMEKRTTLALLLFAEHQGRCHFVVRISPDLVTQGVSAKELVAQISSHIEGKGGGKADSAQGAGSKPEQIPQAQQHARKWISSL